MKFNTAKFKYFLEKHSVPNMLSIFWQYLLSYVILLIIPVLIFSLFNLRTALGSAKRNDENNYRNLLNSASIYVNKVFDNLDVAESRIESSSWLRDLYFENIVYSRKPDYQLINQINKDLAYINAWNPESAMLSVKLYQDDTVYSTSGIFNATSNYDELTTAPIGIYKFFPLSGDEKEGLSSFTDTNTKTKYLLYRSRISNTSSGSANSAKGEMNMLLRQSVFERNIAKILGDESAAVTLYDDKGQEIYSFSKGLKANDDLIRLENTSNNVKYRIALSVPERSYFKNRSSVYRLMWVTLIIALILSMLLAVFLSYRSYRPIMNLIKRLGGQSESPAENEFTLIGNDISTLIFEKSIAQEELQKVKPIISQNLLKWLLDGFNMDFDNLRKTENYGITFPYDKYCVISAQIPFSQIFGENDENEFMTAMIAVEKTVALLIESAGIVGYTYNSGIDNFEIILNFQKKESMENFIIGLSDDCNAFFGNYEKKVSLYFGVGNIVYSEDQICKSYKEAQQALEYSVVNKGGNVIFFSDVNSDTQGEYCYTLADEIALVNSINSGNAVAANSILTRIFQEKLARSHPDLHTARCIYYDMISTLVKALQGLGFSRDDFIDSKYTEKVSNLYEMESYLKQIVEKICSCLQNDRKKKSNDLEDKIMEYVNGNLYNPLLSLNQISDKFHVSMSYISLIFKNRTGVSYLEYLNKSRIDKATALLKDKKMTMEQVAEQIGYTSLSTFRRNFIKYTSQRPSTLSGQK